MFRRRKKAAPQIEFDPARQKAVIKCSICHGEQVAGFKDIETGKFTEVMLIQNANDLEFFKKQYGVSEISKEY